MFSKETISAVQEPTKLNPETNWEHVVENGGIVQYGDVEVHVDSETGMSFTVDGTQRVTLTNGEVYFVPPDPRNRHYSMVQEWKAEQE